MGIMYINSEQKMDLHVAVRTMECFDSNRILWGHKVFNSKLIIMKKEK